MFRAFLLYRSEKKQHYCMCFINIIIVLSLFELFKITNNFRHIYYESLTTVSQKITVFSKILMQTKNNYKSRLKTKKLIDQ